jgi:hypothetical protein
MRVASRLGGLAIPSLLSAIIACDAPPARIVVGNADTVIVNNIRPVRLHAHVFDAKNHELQDSGVRYRWTGDTPLTVASNGDATCHQDGDATVNASLGGLMTNFVIRCRPVDKILTDRMVNLIVGGPPQTLPFEALGPDGRAVTLLAGQVTIIDSTIAAVDGARIRALKQGQTGLKMRFGNREAFAEVLAYQLVHDPEDIRPGDHLGVPISLRPGEMRKWRLPASPQEYFVTMLPDSDGQQIPRFVIVGAACSPALGANTFFCLARTDASVTVYYPRNVAAPRNITGTLAIWRQAWTQ